MSTSQREEQLAVYGPKAARRLARAGDHLRQRQARSGSTRGNVPPWPGCDDADFHGTLAAIWVWSRAQVLTGEPRFGANVGAAWGFVENVWERFLPAALDARTGPEAAYDCAMILRAGLATHALAGTGDWRRHGDAAARLLAGYLADVEPGDTPERGFLDPGFLAWNLADYARATGDRGLTASVGRFIDKAYGTRPPTPFADEPAAKGELFDFSSTSATHVLAVMASEGDTPFTGSWLRERVLSALPPGWTRRPGDENTWNACVATMAGRAYLISTDERFFRLHQDLIEELVGRTADDGAPGRAPGFPPETLATFYYCLALESMAKSGSP